MNPYKIIEEGNDYQIRRFGIDIDDEELLWHRDKEDRLIEVLSGSGWYLQKENLLPEKLKINENYFIRNREESNCSLINLISCFLVIFIFILYKFNLNY